MATVRIPVLSVLLMAGALVAFADDGGKSIAKTNAHASAKSVTAKSAAKQAAAPVAPGPGRMQVEEPDAAVPDAKASKAWQKTHAKGGLTEDQKKAFRERKEKMEDMIAVIKAKRKALAAAKPEERAALARELHSLILEKDMDPATVTAAARLDGGKDNKGTVAAGAAKSAEAQKAQLRDEIRRQQLEKLKQWKATGDDGD